MGQLYYHVQPFVTLEANQLIEKEVNNSFPSDHTMVMFSFLFVLFLASKSQTRGLYLVWAAVASLARIFVGVHYPSDVLVAAVTASFVGSIFYYTLNENKRLGNFVEWLGHIEGKVIHKRM